MPPISPSHSLHQTANNPPQSKDKMVGRKISSSRRAAGKKQFRKGESNSITTCAKMVFTWRTLFVISLAFNAVALRHYFYYYSSENVFIAFKHLIVEKTGELVAATNNNVCFQHQNPQQQMCTGASTAEQQSESESESESSPSPSKPKDDPDVLINFDHGDPTMFESYWMKMGHKSSIVIPGWQSLSYISDFKQVCWFLESEFADQVKRLHQLVGNAKTEDRHIVVGTGSTQLYQALLYALSPGDAIEPINVVSASPFYSSYPLQTDFLKSGLYKWGGDAYKYDKEGAYIELVCSPNNPDGYTMEPVVNREGGIVIYDLAYYWPQYTPITYAADHDLMLFTVSKSTGHAGTRIGWALVKDQEVAKKMTKYIELNTIGVSKDSQLRAAKILSSVSDGCERANSLARSDCLFEFGRHLMTRRWESLRKAVRHSGMFSLPEFSRDYCNHAGVMTEPHPAFAWLKCLGGVDDCESFLRERKIITRSGKHFGKDLQYVRISMLDRDHLFDLFVERLSNI